MNGEPSSGRLTLFTVQTRITQHAHTPKRQHDLAEQVGIKPLSKRMTTPPTSMLIDTFARSTAGMTRANSGDLAARALFIQKYAADAFTPILPATTFTGSPDVRTVSIICSRSLVLYRLLMLTHCRRCRSLPTWGPRIVDGGLRRGYAARQALVDRALRSMGRAGTDCARSGAEEASEKLVRGARALLERWALPNLGSTIHGPNMHIRPSPAGQEGGGEAFDPMGQAPDEDVVSQRRSAQLWVEDEAVDGERLMVSKIQDLEGFAEQRA
jgi:hypothetical protein